jgi:SAM-dependent methyltransferase
MNSVALQSDQYEEDRAKTLRNRRKLNANANLLYWYRQLYHEQFAGLDDITALRILEIGSGVSPLKRFYETVLTSDVLQLDYLDYVFDCHNIDRFEQIADASLDVIALTNVLHHLKDPIEFLRKAALKLKEGGHIVATEPYFSTLSTFIFKHLHHEAVDLHVTQPVLTDIKGPLASANIALPWLIFIRNPAWRERLRDRLNPAPGSLLAFSSISYMATGGISHRIPIPALLYRLLFHVDLFLSRRFPKLFASFFTIRLTRK